MTVSSTSNDSSGLNPRIVLSFPISSAPRADPWEAPVFIFVGAGYAMIVRSWMNEGRSVTAFAASIASRMPVTFSPPSNSWTCQP